MRRALILSTLLLAGPSLLRAQAAYSECSDPLIGLSQNNINLCNAAVDASNIYQPVAGLLVSGGNPVLGSVQTLGGFPHFALTVRVNATQVGTPDLSYDGTGTTVSQDDEAGIPAPVIEGALGVLKGFGPSGFLSLDLLASAQLLPTDQVEGVSVDDDARKIGDIALGLGFGARVGVLRAKGLIPAVTVSVMRRNIPKIIIGDVAAGDESQYGVDLQSTSLRAVAGYKFSVLVIGAGIGYDKYTGEADIQLEDQNNPGSTIAIKVDLDNSRNMAFLTGALDFTVVKLGAEVGYQLGKDENMRTTFEGTDPADNRLFASAGIRFSF